MKQLLAAFALLAVTVAPAFEGRMHATIEGPAKDGVTYTMRALECPPRTRLKPWVCADGLADGKINSIRLAVVPTAVSGVYTFKRTWPHRGDWMLRVCLDDPLPAPATVASVGHDGRVGKNQLFWNTYGVAECRKVLVKLAKAQGIALDTGC